MWGWSTRSPIQGPAGAAPSSTPSVAPLQLRLNHRTLWDAPDPLESHSSARTPPAPPRRVPRPLLLLQPFALISRGKGGQGERFFFFFFHTLSLSTLPSGLSLSVFFRHWPRLGRPKVPGWSPPSTGPCPSLLPTALHLAPSVDPDLSSRLSPGSLDLSPGSPPVPSTARCPSPFFFPQNRHRNHSLSPFPILTVP